LVRRRRSGESFRHFAALACLKTIGFYLAPLLVLLAACNTDPKVVSRKYVERGNTYFAQRKYKEASILYRRALNKDLRSADAWYRLGLVNAQLGGLAEARKDFSRAMELNPANLDAVVQLGDLDLAFYLLDPGTEHGYLADLREIAERLLRQDPRSFHGLRFSGSIALARNDTRAAIRAFEAANQVQPGQPDLVLTLVQTLFAAQQGEAGEKLARQLMESRKTFAQIYDALYIHLLRANRPELAEQVLARKISNNPSRAAYLIQLASHYVLVHRPADVLATLARLTSDPKRFPDGRLEVGDFFVRVRDYPAALREFQAGEQQFRRQNTKAARVYRKKIAEVLATEGRGAEAGAMVADLLREDSKDPEARALQATLWLASSETRQVKAALWELRELTKAMPANATLHFNLGRAYLAATDQQNLPAAREQLEIAIRIDPHHAPAKLAWAELELSGGEPARAVQAADEVSREDPSNPVAHLIRGRSFLKMADPAKARAELTVLLGLSPAASILNDARAQLAELDLGERRYHEAQEGFQALVRANDSRGALGLVQCGVAQGQWQQAEQIASEQLRHSPDRQDYRMALAHVYVASGNFAAAAGQFQALIGKDPRSARLYLQLGEAKIHGSDSAGALSAFQTARQLAPGDAATALDLALLYDQTGRLKEARKEYQAAIQLQPENAAALNNLAYIEAEEGVDLDQALAHAQQAQQRMPDNPNIQDTLALVYIRKNLTSDGIRLLRDLVSRNPDNATFHLHLALALYQKGDRLWAKRELQAAARNQPEPKEQDKIKELLAKIG
jgi:tetratricopeptide (TPR) repeat protein